MSRCFISNHLRYLRMAHRVLLISVQLTCAAASGSEIAGEAAAGLAAAYKVMKANKYGAASDVNGYLSHAKDLYSFATGSPGSYQDLKDPCLAQHGELYKSTGGDLPLLANRNAATFQFPGAGPYAAWGASGASCLMRSLRSHSGHGRVAAGLHCACRLSPSDIALAVRCGRDPGCALSVQRRRRIHGRAGVGGGMAVQGHRHRLLPG